MPRMSPRDDVANLLVRPQSRAAIGRQDQVQEQEGRRRDHRDDEVADRARTAAKASNSRMTPAAIAGRTRPAWLASVPYQGIRPRSSRNFGRPEWPRPSRRRPGPPRNVAAMIGAIATACCVPGEAEPGGPTRPASERSRRQRPRADLDARWTPAVRRAKMRSSVVRQTKESRPQVQLLLRHDSRRGRASETSASLPGVTGPHTAQGRSPPNGW